MELIPKEIEKIQKKNSVPLKIADTAKFWQNDAFLGYALPGPSTRNLENIPKPGSLDLNPRSREKSHTRLERDFFTDNLLVQVHFIILIIWWTGLAPWELEFPFPHSSHQPSALNPHSPPSGTTLNPHPSTLSLEPSTLNLVEGLVTCCLSLPRSLSLSLSLCLSLCLPPSLSPRVRPAWTQGDLVDRPRTMGV